MVHRKGATPASLGTLGIIPGSMGTPGYVVRGKGNEKSLLSASHGAGRRMSRHATKNTFTKRPMLDFLAERRITLLSAELHACPMAYQHIEQVMRQQAAFVATAAKFDASLVRLAEDRETTED